MSEHAKIAEEARVCGLEWAMQVPAGESLPEWNGLTTEDFAAIRAAIGGRALTDIEAKIAEDAAEAFYRRVRSNRKR